VATHTSQLIFYIPTLPCILGAMERRQADNAARAGVRRDAQRQAQKMAKEAAVLLDGNKLRVWTRHVQYLAGKRARKKAVPSAMVSAAGVMCCGRANLCSVSQSTLLFCLEQM